MKLAIATAGLAAAFLGGPTAAADLTLTLRAQGAGGMIAIAVYDDPEAFRLGRNPIATRMVPARGGASSATVTGLAPGRYAVAAFHDADANGTLTLWPFGLPREAYGFSRDARGRLGPPAFAVAAFDLPAEGTRQAITLR